MGLRGLCRNNYIGSVPGDFQGDSFANAPGSSSDEERPSGEFPVEKMDRKEISWGI